MGLNPFRILLISSFLKHFKDLDSYGPKAHLATHLTVIIIFAATDIAYSGAFSALHCNIFQTTRYFEECVECAESLSVMTAMQPSAEENHPEPQGPL